MGGVESFSSSSSKLWERRRQQRQQQQSRWSLPAPAAVLSLPSVCTKVQCTLLLFEKNENPLDDDLPPSSASSSSSSSSSSFWHHQHQQHHHHLKWAQRRRLQLPHSSYDVWLQINNSLFKTNHLLFCPFPHDKLLPNNKKETSSFKKKKKNILEVTNSLIKFKQRKKERKKEYNKA